MADGLCIGSPGLVGGRKAGNSNMQDFFAPSCRSCWCMLGYFRQFMVIPNLENILRAGLLGAYPTCCVFESEVRLT